jgi:hypothetical protein
VIESLQAELAQAETYQQQLQVTEAALADKSAVVGGAATGTGREPVGGLGGSACVGVLPSRDRDADRADQSRASLGI